MLKYIFINVDGDTVVIYITNAVYKSDYPFDSEGYITKLKLDGIRLIYSVDEEEKVHLSPVTIMI